MPPKGAPQDLTTTISPLAAPYSGAVFYSPFNCFYGSNTPYTAIHSCAAGYATTSTQYIVDNVLNREFHATVPNEKWLTDVTEFKWYEGVEVRKVYLSAILDLYDRRIVSFAIGDRNDNPLVFKTFDMAVKATPDAHPLFHSDRGCQYTSRTFHHKLEKAGMAQSMSRVAKCIDNGPMEEFWGILKRERYYGKRFTSKQKLIH